MAKKPHFRLVPYRLLPWIDWPLIVVTLTMFAFGIVTLWGATSDGQGPGRLAGYALRQCIWGAAGVGLMVALTVFDYRRLQGIVWPLYGVLLVLLAGLLFKAESIKGAQSWYDLGFFRFQPSEPGKIILALVLARHLAPRAAEFRGLRHTLAPLAIVGAPLLLILKQPDLGTAVVLVPMAGAMFWVAGLRKWVVILFVALGCVLAVAAYPHLKPHQKNRIISFLNPEADPRGKGYNIIQAQTALGSGRMFGKGWGRGTQTTFRYLPEYHTDFIYPTVGEQFGLAGCVVVLVLLAFFIGRMVHLANVTQDVFGLLLVTGLATMLATHTILNIGMTVGLLPVTGLPLPFFSYGGSFMLTCMVSVGLTLSVGARRGL
ncbi:MAG: rod shape-determining protein RodA [bacterium]|nr:rod shape-determining protein RodA [bacterium]